MKTPYSYIVLRYVHDILTGEFLNVGIVVYSAEQRILDSQFRLAYGRLSKTFPGLDGEAYKSMLKMIQIRIGEISRKVEGGLFTQTAITELVREALPEDASSFQWSPPGGGLTGDISSTLDEVYERMVMRYEAPVRVVCRTDEEIWRGFRHGLEINQVMKHLEPKLIAGQDDEVEFRHAWKNGIWHCLEPISFDLASAESIRDKAHKWVGQMCGVQDVQDQFKVYVLLGESQDRSLLRTIDKAIRILDKAPVEKEIYREHEALKFSEAFSAEIAKHERSQKLNT